MYYRIEEYAVKTFVDYLRRVFRYNSSWVNSGLQIVQFPSGSAELVFEQFFEDNEKYPIITIGTQGGNFAQIAFNDFIDSYDSDVVPFGTRMQSSVVLDGTHSLAVQLPPVTLDDTARAIKVTMAATSYQSGGDNIYVNLYSGFRSTPILVASASIPGNLDTSFNELYGEFYPFVPLTAQDYWVTFVSPSGSSYYIGIDTTATTLYQYPSGSVNATGSINGGVVLPAFWRYGTNFEGSVLINCQSANSSRDARKLAELTVQYFTMAKHAQISRLSGATDGLRLGEFQQDGPQAIGEFLEKDLMLRQIRIGPLGNRRRGENDIIFTVPVTVDYYSEWHEDFQAQPLRTITETIVPFDP